jgi:hypothetical protein
VKVFSESMNRISTFVSSAQAELRDIDHSGGRSDACLLFLLPASIEYGEVDAFRISAGFVTPDVQFDCDIRGNHNNISYNSFYLGKRRVS